MVMFDWYLYNLRMEIDSLKTIGSDMYLDADIGSNHFLGQII